MIAALQAAAGDAAARRSARQEHRHRRDQLRRAARAHPRADRRRRGRGRDALVAAVRAARARLLVRADVFTGVSQAHRIAREEIFGPVLSVLTFRTPAEAVEKANNTPYGLSAGVWTEKGSRILWMANAAARRRGVGEHVQPLRPGLAVRRLQGVGLRPRRRPARAGGLPCPLDRLATGVARAQDVQALHRRRVPALGVRPRPTRCTTRPGRAARARRAGLAQGRRATPSSPRARRSPAGRARPPTTAARCSTASPRCSTAGASSSPPRSPRPRGSATAAALRAVDAVDRPLGLVRGLGRQVRPGRRERRTRSPGRTSTSRCPSRPAWSAIVAPQDSPPARARVACSHPSSPPATRPSSSPREERPLPAVSLAEVLATSDLPGGVVEPAHRLHGRARARGSPATAT